MIESGVPLSFWYQACCTAVFLTNRIITKTVDEHKTPFEMWHYRKPSVEHLRVFGCQEFRLLRKELRTSKFSAVASGGILVGFDQDNFNYQVYDLNDKKVYMSHDVKFNESSFPLRLSKESITSSDNDRVRMMFFDEEDNEEVVNENYSHTDPLIPVSVPEVVVDELTTHTDSHTPEPSTPHNSPGLTTSETKSSRKSTRTISKVSSQPPATGHWQARDYHRHQEVFKRFSRDFQEVFKRFSIGFQQVFNRFSIGFQHKFSWTSD